jgi:hypothetical protein
MDGAANANGGSAQAPTLSAFGFVERFPHPSSIATRSVLPVLVNQGCPDTRAASGTCSRRRGAFPDPAESGGLDGAFLDQRSLQRFEALVERVAVEVRPPGEEPFLERRQELVTHRRVAMQIAMVGQPGAAPRLIARR